MTLAGATSAAETTMKPEAVGVMTVAMPGKLPSRSRGVAEDTGPRKTLRTRALSRLEKTGKATPYFSPT